MTLETKRYLDEAATARFLDVSCRTLQRWRRDGGGPAFTRAGMRRILYDVTGIQKWAEARTFAHRAAELARTVAR
jgi:predicted site-specific integrase-resolvase